MIPSQKGRSHVRRPREPSPQLPQRARAQAPGSPRLLGGVPRHLDPCAKAPRSQRGVVLERQSTRVKGRDSRPLSALLSQPRRFGNHRGRATPTARQPRCKGLEGGYVLDGTRPCTKVSRKREPSPLTSRARTHAPACLSQSPRSIKGRLTEHRDPVARRTPGSEERVRCSAAAPARS